MGRIADAVSDKARELAQALGLTLWHVEYGKEPSGYVLRVIIDKPGGISTEDCEAISRAIDPWLDQADPIPGPYTLEVSSPGIERVLHTCEQRAQYIGEAVAVKLFAAVDGRRAFQGELLACQPEIELRCDGVEYAFPPKAVAQIKLLYQP